MTPGVGVGIMDSRGGLLFVNETSQLLFSNCSGVDYRNKTIYDFHPPEFCEERIAMISRVLAENRPLSIRHIYSGRAIESTVWPIGDDLPPFDRVIVVSQNKPNGSLAAGATSQIETVSTQYIDLGPLEVLSRRELEVLVLLGHGLRIPEAAETLHRSPNTIQRHKESISRKLALHGQAALVHVVASMGLKTEDTTLRRYHR